MLNNNTLPWADLLGAPTKRQGESACRQSVLAHWVLEEPWGAGARETWIIAPPFQIFLAGFFPCVSDSSQPNLLMSVTAAKESPYEHDRERKDKNRGRKGSWGTETLHHVKASAKTWLGKQKVLCIFGHKNNSMHSCGPYHTGWTKGNQSGPQYSQTLPRIIGIW